VHCGQSSGLCANGQTDSLPDEPGGYSGYKALFGKLVGAAGHQARPGRSTT